MDLREYLRVIRAHWLGIVLITVVGVVAAFGWTLIQPKVYSADSTAIVQANADYFANQAGTAASVNTLVTGRVKTYAALGESRSVAEGVIQALDLKVSPADLVKQVRVTSAVDTQTLSVTANAGTPEKARDIAEAWVTSMGAEINRVESGSPQTKGAVFLSQLDSALLPERPSSPNTALALVLGGLLGLAIAISYGLLRHTLDQRIRSVEQTERETGLSVVGTIPEEPAFADGDRLLPEAGPVSSASSNAHLFTVSEAFRELRTNLQYMDVDDPPRIVVVTSPLPGDGKSLVAANLAVTLAASGQPVVLIDADLRRPVQHTVFGVPAGAGISDVLAGRASITDVAHRFGEGKLLVVCAGKLPPNPSEMLGSVRMRELLHTISREAVVVIDSPPLIPVTDAAVLAHSADGAIVVSTVGRTRYDVLGRALGNLERVGARTLGIVLNRVPLRGQGAAYFGYQYHGDYYVTEEEQTQPLKPAGGRRRAGSPTA